MQDRVQRERGGHRGQHHQARHQQPAVADRVVLAQCQYPGRPIRVVPERVAEQLPTQRHEDREQHRQSVQHRFAAVHVLVPRQPQGAPGGITRRPQPATPSADRSARRGAAADAVRAGGPKPDGQRRQSRAPVGPLRPAARGTGSPARPVARRNHQTACRRRISVRGSCGGASPDQRAPQHRQSRPRSLTTLPPIALPDRRARSKPDLLTFYRTESAGIARTVSNGRACASGSLRSREGTTWSRRLRQPEVHRSEFRVQ